MLMIIEIDRIQVWSRTLKPKLICGSGELQAEISIPPRPAITLRKAYFVATQP